MQACGIFYLNKSAYPYKSTFHDFFVLRFVNQNFDKTTFFLLSRTKMCKKDQYVEIKPIMHEKKHHSVLIHNCTLETYIHIQYRDRFVHVW